MIIKAFKINRGSTRETLELETLITIHQERGRFYTLGDVKGLIESDKSFNLVDLMVKNGSLYLYFEE